MKRAGIISLITTSSIILIIGILVALSAISKVQTAAVQTLANTLGERIQSNIHIGKVNYSFFNRILLTDILIHEQNEIPTTLTTHNPQPTIDCLQNPADTLLFVDTLEAHFNFWRLFRKEILFDEVNLQHVVGKIEKYPTHDSLPQWNFSFLIDAFKTDKPKQPMQAQVSVRNITLTDGRIKLIFNNAQDDSITSNVFDLQDLSTRLSLNYLSQDSLDAQIETLLFNEAQGFILNNLEAHLIATPTQATLTPMRLQLPHSQLNITRANITYGHTQADTTIRLPLPETQFAFTMQQTSIVPADLSRFLPILQRLHAPLDIALDMEGRLDSFATKICTIDYDHYPVLRGRVSAIGLPNWQTAYLRAELQDLRIDQPVVQDVLSNLQNRPYQLPDILKRLGTVHYKGAVQGRADNLRLQGLFTTRFGNLGTEGTLLATDSFQTFSFNGKLQADKIQLGNLLDNKDIGILSMNASVNGHGGGQLPFYAKLNANVPIFEYKEHTFKGLHLNGHMHPKRWEGEIHMNDSLANFTFNGLADLSGKLTRVDANMDIQHLHLGEIFQLAKYPDAILSTNININGTGKCIDNVNGKLLINNLIFTQSDKRLSIPQFSIEAKTKDKTEFKINSPYLNANFFGKYQYSQVQDKLIELASRMLPEAVSMSKWTNTKHTVDNTRVEFYAYFTDIDSILQALDLPIRLPSTQTVRGAIIDSLNMAVLRVLVPEINLNKLHLNDFTIDLRTPSKDAVHMDASVVNKVPKTSQFGQQLGDIRLRLTADARHDSLITQLAFDNFDATLHNKGQLNLITHFMRYNSQPLIDVHLQPSEFVLADSTFSVTDSHITYNVADTMLAVSNLHIIGGKQQLYVNGLASTSEQDSLLVRLEQLDLGYLLSYTEVAKSISFGGGITGWATVYSLFNQPKFEADVTMPNATLNHYPLGDAVATAKWNREAKSIDIQGDVTENERRVAHVDGKVDIAARHWGLDILADSTNLTFINGWTNGICTIKQGRGFGNVVIGGDMTNDKKVYITCKAKAQEAAIGVDIIGTTYTFTDSVFMDSTAIRFPNITLHDKVNNPLTLNGIITHNGQFQNMAYNLSMRCRNALALDLPESPDNFFYGQVYANGNVSIVGNTEECHIDASARTAKNTDFRLSLETNSNAMNNNFITFVDHTIQTKKKENEIPIPQNNNTHVYLNLAISATPDANVAIVIDSRTDDVLIGRGTGDIALSYDVNADDIKMLGTYELESGSLHFTFQNVIRKDFTIQEGSKVIWTGNPEDPEIQASAYYSTTASLKDLFGTEYEQVGTNRSSVPVNCVLNLKDQLMNPVINFGIELPQSDEALRSQVNSIISTEEMLMRQVLYLLIFNRFFTPEYLQGDNATVGLNETYSLLSSTVTSQINSWIQKLTNHFSVGFNIRTDGQGSESSQEYETQFQIQPISRLLINGNFGYRYNDISNQPIFGNLDVEYLLSENGHWRAKAYTHTVDKYSVRQAQTIQGLGLLFKYDFSSTTKREREFSKRIQKHMRELEKEEKAKAKEAKAKTKAEAKAQKTNTQNTQKQSKHNRSNQ